MRKMRMDFKHEVVVDKVTDVDEIEQGLSVAIREADEFIRKRDLEVLAEVCCREDRAVHLGILRRYVIRVINATRRVEIQAASRIASR